jgi:hypothetical protein
MGCKCNSRSESPCDYCCGDEWCECGSEIAQNECDECCDDCHWSLEICECDKDDEES